LPYLAIGVTQISNKTISNNVTFVSVNLWSLCAERTELGHMSWSWSWCSLHHSGIQFSFLYWTAIIISSPAFIIEKVERRLLKSTGLYRSSADRTRCS